MKRLLSEVPLMAGMAFVAMSTVQPATADSVRVPIRSANARTAQLDPNLPPAPIPVSPTPLPVAPVPELPPSVKDSLPPQPVPDSPVPSQAMPDELPPPPSNGGPMYRRPLGSDFIREKAPPRVYLGDENGPGSKSQRKGAGTVTGVDPYGIAPPPGTLGQTYQRRSRMIDDEKHPRMGAVDVHLSENYDVSAKGLKAKWTGKVWNLSTDTLLPGIPHIYEVKAEWGPEGAKQSETRSVRLIMNRIVDLEF